MRFCHKKLILTRDGFFIEEIEKESMVKLLYLLAYLAIDVQQINIFFKYICTRLKYQLPENCYTITFCI